MNEIDYDGLIAMPLINGFIVGFISKLCNREKIYLFSSKNFIRAMVLLPIIWTIFTYMSLVASNERKYIMLISQKRQSVYGDNNLGKLYFAVSTSSSLALMTGLFAGRITEPHIKSFFLSLLK